MRKGLASLVLAGSGVMAGFGCESIEMTPAGEALGRSMLFQGAAVYSDTPQEAAGWNILAEGSRAKFQMEAAKEAAREGRSEVHVYTNGGNKERGFKEKASTPFENFTIGHYIDKDGNGKLNSGNEFIEFPTDNVFYRNSCLIFSVNIARYGGENVRVILKNSDGNICGEMEHDVRRLQYQERNSAEYDFVGSTFGGDFLDFLEIPKNDGRTYSFFVELFEGNEQIPEEGRKIFIRNKLK